MSSRKRAGREEEDEKAKKRRFDEVGREASKSLKTVLVELDATMRENFKNFEDYMNRRFKEIEFCLNNVGEKVKAMELMLKGADEKVSKPKKPCIPQVDDLMLDADDMMGANLGAHDDPELVLEG